MGVGDPVVLQQAPNHSIRNTCRLQRRSALSLLAAQVCFTSTGQQRAAMSMDSIGALPATGESAVCDVRDRGTSCRQPGRLSARPPGNINRRFRSWLQGIQLQVTSCKIVGPRSCSLEQRCATSCLPSDRRVGSRSCSNGSGAHISGSLPLPAPDAKLSRQATKLNSTLSLGSPLLQVWKSPAGGSVALNGQAGQLSIAKLHVGCKQQPALTLEPIAESHQRNRDLHQKPALAGAQ